MDAILLKRLTGLVTALGPTEDPGGVNPLVVVREPYAKVEPFGDNPVGERVEQTACSVHPLGMNMRPSIKAREHVREQSDQRGVTSVLFE